ncbi:hypothetical protein L1766_07175 [Thermovorax subterraneus]|nr:hypothetical protein [Thermovorax subterraneus]
MPRKCTICEHPKKEEINEMLVKGESLRNIAKHFSVNFTALYRHKEKHLPAELIKSHEAQEVAQASTLLEQITDLRDRALRILEKAEKAGKLKTALEGIKEARGCLELLAKLQGELAQEGTINITISPQWLEIRAVILKALEPYPEARIKLAEALKEVENIAGS